VDDGRWRYTVGGGGRTVSSIRWRVSEGFSAGETRGRLGPLSFSSLVMTLTRRSSSAGSAWSWAARTARA
jgi:hypothetical protein